LAAARQGDQVNPLKASSGSQFYIVHGQKVTEQMLNQVETGINNQRKQALTNEVFNDSANIYLKERILFFRQIQNKDSFDHYLAKINAIVDKEFSEKEFHYTDSAKAKYIRIGDTPNLDANYTVFGEVIEGLNIVDSIAMVKTNRGDRPAEDVIIKIKRIN
jgi:cyclophilin family peptidyl-prolyl cis-trans isomerase